MNTTLQPEVQAKDPVHQAIYSRRAVRKFTKKEVDPNVLKEIIAAGTMAPSAMNRQPWKFYILHDPKTIAKVSQAITKVSSSEFSPKKPNKFLQAALSLFQFSRDLGLFQGADPIFHHAPVVILIAAPIDNEWAALDIGMCAQNIMLAAQSYGLASCPIGLAKFVSHTSLYPHLNIPQTEQIQLGIILGYGDEHPAAHKRETGNIHYINLEEKLL